MTKPDFSKQAQDIAAQYVGLLTPTGISLEATIENALVVAYLKGRKSVLDRIPSEEEIDNSRLDWFGNQIVCSDACSLGFEAGVNWLKEKLIKDEVSGE